MPDTPAIVGFVGFCESMREGTPGRVGGGDKEMWCSGGPEGMVRGQDREDSGFFGCSRRAEASLPCSVGP